MAYTLREVNLLNIKFKKYTKRTKIRLQEFQDTSLALGESVEHKAMSTYETTPIINDLFLKQKMDNEDIRKAILSLSKTAKDLLEIIKYESTNKLFFKSLNDGGTQTNGKYANINLLNLGYEWYIKYFNAYVGNDKAYKPLASKNYYSILKELIAANILSPSKKDGRSFYHYNISFFSVGNEMKLIQEYCLENGLEMPSVQITQEYLQEQIEKIN